MCYLNLGNYINIIYFLKCIFENYFAIVFGVNDVLSFFRLGLFISNFFVILGVGYSWKRMY